MLVADTHYFRVLIYSRVGELLEQIGGTEGPGPGEFGFVTDVVDDRFGNLYVSEYGEYDRIQKLAPDGTFLMQWGGHGSEPGQFLRPQHLEIDEQDHMWVCDACNHRIQVFDLEGNLLDVWGTAGSEPGQLYYPYVLVFDDQQNVYICEYGNHRVQKFTRSGQPLGCWGSEGWRSGGCTLLRSCRIIRGGFTCSTRTITASSVCGCSWCEIHLGRLPPHPAKERT